MKRFPGENQDFHEGAIYLRGNRFVKSGAPIYLLGNRFIKNAAPCFSPGKCCITNWQVTFIAGSANPPTAHTATSPGASLVVMHYPQGFEPTALGVLNNTTTPGAV